ncbi:hypothetical protein [Streptomyces sp. S.PNR 29]|uniref:hypothetical protein n=1 Tax=Streptomyces sp. S.PNR 29 TaxID=2973805 RepID=UPI0025B0CFBF|nr:hypothetical protein [Streptomyces sp. S.PNR 29]MDN0194586.1 hypothetical protein [Streptomyces sp. S.PNR 29]
MAAYDYEERLWNPPAPLLFQWDRAGEPSRMTGEFIRRALAEVLAFIGVTDTTGRPMDFAPHDFRRMFIPTEAEWEDFLGHFERRKLSVESAGYPQPSVPFTSECPS